MENRLEALRRARRLTQEELAALVGTTGDQISRLERGERKLTANWLERLARGLGCEGVEILGGTVLDQREQLWLDSFRKMSEIEKHRWLRLVAELAEPAEIPTDTQIRAGGLSR